MYKGGGKDHVLLVSLGVRVRVTIKEEYMHDGFISL